jgi:hypothetical protein
VEALHAAFTPTSSVYVVHSAGRCSATGIRVLAPHKTFQPAITALRQKNQVGIPIFMGDLTMVNSLSIQIALS